MVIRGQPRGGPPPERTLALSNIMAPRMARRANPNVDGSSETKDEVGQYLMLVNLAPQGRGSSTHRVCLSVSLSVCLLPF